MLKLPFAIPVPGRHQVGGAPEGADALLIATLAMSAPGGVLHIARDELHMVRMTEMLRFVAPDLTVIEFPAWDCLPYDRASPHRDILARRIDALTRLAALPEDARGKLVVVTTVSAILQRVPEPASFALAGLVIRRGGQLEQSRLIDYLVGKGYARSGTVGEAGEFAVRGGIVDLFPPGTQMPLRVDFFGDEVEDLRLFDPLSQRSLGKVEEFALKPINEIELTPEAIERFRTNYRSEFGTSGADDPLYEAISAGRQYPGMEHWLPLFGTELVSFADYLPRAIVTLDHQGDEAAKARYETIVDFYQARRDLQAADRESGAAIYRPLAMVPPARLAILAIASGRGGGEVTRVVRTFAFHRPKAGTMVSAARPDRRLPSARRERDSAATMKIENETPIPDLQVRAICAVGAVPRNDAAIVHWRNCWLYDDDYLALWRAAQLADQLLIMAAIKIDKETRDTDVQAARATPGMRERGAVRLRPLWEPLRAITAARTGSTTTCSTTMRANAHPAATGADRSTTQFASHFSSRAEYRSATRAQMRRPAAGQGDLEQPSARQRAAARFYRLSGGPQPIGKPIGGDGCAARWWKDRPG